MTPLCAPYTRNFRLEVVLERSRCDSSNNKRNPTFLLSLGGGNVVKLFDASYPQIETRNPPHVTVVHSTKKQARNSSPTSPEKALGGTRPTTSSFNQFLENV